jgi:hypothetical protein
MQLPISRELARALRSGSWRSFLRFGLRIYREGRIGELLLNVLREFRYAAVRPYQLEQGAQATSANLQGIAHLLADRIANLGFEKIDVFMSCEENKYVVLRHMLVSSTVSTLHFYDHHRKLLRSVEGGGRIRNFVCIGVCVYFIVDGRLRSVTVDGDVQDEGLVLSSPASRVLDQGIAAAPDGTLVVAEYKHDACGVSGAYAYVRRPYSDRWEAVTALAKRVDKHCHIVVFDPYTARFYITCGDNRKMLACLDVGPVRTDVHIISTGTWRAGGFMCAAVSDASIICGTDYTGGTNYLVEVSGGRIRNKSVLRMPFRRSIVTAIDISRAGTLYTAWNMGHLPNVCNGIMLGLPRTGVPLCYSKDHNLTFDMYSTRDGVVVRMGFPDRFHFLAFRSRDE